MNPQIERISEGFILSESPHWDAKTQNLYYVDIFGKKIFRYNPTSTELTAADLGGANFTYLILKNFSFLF